MIDIMCVGLSLCRVYVVRMPDLTTLLCPYFFSSWHSQYGIRGYCSLSLSLSPIQVNGCLLDPLPPPTVLRKSSTSSPSNMMETSIDEGIETEEPDTEDDQPHLLMAYQTARFGQRRHTLSEVTNQPNQGIMSADQTHTFTLSHASSANTKAAFWIQTFSPLGKLFTLGHNPSMGSVDSDMGYDMGSMQSDLGLLEDPPALCEMVATNSSAPGVSPAPFLSTQPANPAMTALTSQHREAHNRSPISFREGRRASDTSLTQGQNHQD